MTYWFKFWDDDRSNWLDGPFLGAVIDKSHSCLFIWDGTF